MINISRVCKYVLRLFTNTINQKQCKAQNYKPLMRFGSFSGGTTKNPVIVLNNRIFYLFFWLEPKEPNPTERAFRQGREFKTS